jgi:pSer/pThr/pTyr-binding forkhead associated (FHA) protein
MGTPTMAAGEAATRFVGRRVATLLRRPPAPLIPASGAIGGRDPEVLVTLMPGTRNAQRVVVLRPGAAIGRDPASSIAIDDPSVSWNHAQIVVRDGVAAVVDQDSSNGTYVNGERVDHSLLLPDDELRIGDAEFRVLRP